MGDIVENRDISLSGSICSGNGKAVRILDGLSQGQQYKELQAYIRAAEPDEDAEEAAGDHVVDFKGLMEINPDCIGWIRFENPDISYPIVQADNNRYYLRRTFEGRYATAGTIFADYRNASDFSDRNTLIYGHHMKNQSMFGQLDRYLDPKFWEENKSFYIYTPEYTCRYEIFSCHVAALDDTESFSVGFTSDETYREYLDYVTEKAVYDTDIDVTDDQSIVTLVTCSSGGERNRLLIHAVLVEKTEADILTE